MKKTTLLFIFLLSFSFQTGADTDSELSFYIEITQMLSFNAGMEYSFKDHWGFHAALGTGIPPGGTFTWSLLAFYRVTNPESLWHLELEAGLPLAYFNFLEGRWIDENPYIDTTYHGYLPGLSVSFGKVTQIGFFGVRLGGTGWFEYKGDRGWEEPGIMPLVNIFYSTRKFPEQS